MMGAGGIHGVVVDTRVGAPVPMAVTLAGLLLFPPVVVVPELVDMMVSWSESWSGSTGLDQSAIDPCSEMSTRECGDPCWVPLDGRDGVSEILLARDDARRALIDQVANGASPRGSVNLVRLLVGLSNQSERVSLLARTL